MNAIGQGLAEPPHGVGHGGGIDTVGIGEERELRGAHRRKVYGPAADASERVISKVVTDATG
jgi:hypothetical protein